MHIKEVFFGDAISQIFIKSMSIYEKLKIKHPIHLIDIYIYMYALSRGAYYVALCLFFFLDWHYIYKRGKF